MRSLQDSSRSISDSVSSWEDGDSTEDITEQTNQTLIKQANSVSIITLFKHYHLQVDDFTRKIICPFLSHKGGRESSGSFYIYLDTNSFWCFGCKTGSKPVDFVSNIDNLSRINAAYKIIELFGADLDDFIISNQEYQDQSSLLIRFAAFIRQFQQTYYQPQDLEFIEEICRTYDNLSDKYQLSNKALESLINQLINKVKCKYSF